MLRTDWGKFIKRIDTNISIILVVVSLFSGAMNQLAFFSKAQTVETAFYFYDSSLFSGITNYIMPVLVAVPISGFLSEELEKGYYNLVIMRTMKIKYVVSKVVVTILSGMYIMTVGSVLFYFILNIMGYPVMQDANSTLYGLYGETIYYALAEQGKGILAAALHMFNYVLTTIPWTMIVLAVCLYIRNKYLLMVIPVLVDKVLILIGYSDSRFSNINPSVWNTMTSAKVFEPMGGLFYVLKVMGIIVCIGVALFLVGMRRKFKNG